MRIDQFIFDARRAHALEFAETARCLGASTCTLGRLLEDGSLLDVFAPQRTQRSAVAGMTDFRSLFFLQTLAADAGMHPVLRIHHQRGPGGLAAHQAFGASSHRMMCETRLAGCGECWASEAARLVLGLPEFPRFESRPPGNLAAANSRVLGSKSLVTWVMGREPWLNRGSISRVARAGGRSGARAASIP